MPETMGNASESQREAQRLVGLRDDQAPASAGTEARRDADEFINRTVELVSRLVDANEYETMDDLRDAIDAALRRFEAMRPGR